MPRGGESNAVAKSKTRSKTKGSGHGRFQVSGIKLGDLDDGFQDAGFRTCIAVKIVEHVVKRGAMSDPAIGIDHTTLNQLDYASEIGRQGISRRLDGDFRSMHRRMFKRNRFGRDPNVHQ